MLLTTKPSRWGVAFGVAALLALPAAGVAQDGNAAQAEPAETEGGITLELNKVEQEGDACRIYLVFENPTPVRYDAFRLDVFMFDGDGVIQKRLAVEAAPLRGDKTTIKLFDAPDTQCDSLARIMINDVIDCATPDGPAANCVDHIAPRSRNDIELIK